MPVQSIENAGGGAWALWEVTEIESELTYASLESCPDDIVHPQKRLEWLAGRALIRSLAESYGVNYVGLRKDEFGKPFLKEHSGQISLSHSYPFVAAQWHPSLPVGIDLEQPKDKLLQVASRVFSMDELADAGNHLTKLCIYWCAKEALYKIYGKRNLLFTDHLRVSPFTLADQGLLAGRIEVGDLLLKAPLKYKVYKDFVVVFTCYPGGL